MYKTKSSKSLMMAASNKSAIMKPQLTSLIDVMTILLVFLLKSFSVEGNLMSVSPEIDLAVSASNKKPVPALNIEVTARQVTVDGAPVIDLSRIQASDSLMIEDLYTRLMDVSATGRMAANGGRIIIQCDQIVDFKVLKKIMYTCGKANMSNFSLLVLEKV